MDLFLYTFWHTSHVTGPLSIDGRSRVVGEERTSEPGAGCVTALLLTEEVSAKSPLPLTRDDAER